MSVSTHSVALVGVDGALVEVEVALGGGLPRTVLVGLPDTSLYEARDRCKAALASSGHGWPDQLVTINLSPATLPKSGSHYDLAIAAAIMMAQQQVPVRHGRDTVMLGELGLAGDVRVVRGLLPALIAARERGVCRAIVPGAQLREAALVSGLDIYGVDNLGDLQEVLDGGAGVAAPPAGDAGDSRTSSLDFADVAGQEEARWALEVAAAGRHHLSLTGPPGVGKTMLASRLPSILPPLTETEALEVSAVHSLAGIAVEGLVRTAPFSDPHHGASAVAMIGGGSRAIRPGAISLAHRGVLFMDEAPEFAPRVLEALRTPLEAGEVYVARASARARFPARFQLVLASNPCPCGYAGSTTTPCRCQPMSVRKYRERLSGPILDRIDIHQRLRQQGRGVAHEPGESSAAMAARVMSARERQAHRYRDLPWATNGEIPGPQLRKLPAPESVELLDEALRKGRLSPRGVDKAWRVAWTIADLDGKARPMSDHVRTALAMRQAEAA